MFSGHSKERPDFFMDVGKIDLKRGERIILLW